MCVQVRAQCMSEWHANYWVEVASVNHFVTGKTLMKAAQTWRDRQCNGLEHVVLAHTLPTVVIHVMY